MNKKLSKLKKQNEKSSIKKFSMGIMAAILGLTITCGTLPVSAYAADDNAKPVATEKKEQVVDKDKEIKEAKAELKKYLDSMDEKVLDNPAIKYDDNTVKDKIKAEIKRAKELLKDDKIDDAKLAEIKKMPFKKVDGKKVGSFRDLTKKAQLDFTVVGDRNMESPHKTEKYKLKYPVLKDNKIIIKTSLKGAVKSGENDNIFIRLNYIKKADFDNTKVDATTEATPRYKKQEYPQKDYSVKAIDGGYEITVQNMPEDAIAVKPVLVLKFADGTNFDCGDLIFVKTLEEMKKEAPKATSVTTKFVIGDSKYVKNENGKDETVDMKVVPFIQNGRTMLPLRYAAEAIGADVKWDEKTRTASFTKDNATASIQIDGDKIKLSDGKEFTMDSKPVNKNDRIFVSITNVAKVFNLTHGDTKDGTAQDIEWDNAARSVTIVKK